MDFCLQVLNTRLHESLREARSYLNASPKTPNQLGRFALPRWVPEAGGAQLESLVFGHSLLVLQQFLES